MFRTSASSLLRRRKVFTLIELLVVIAVIVLLLAILLPALSTVRKNAAIMACASNMRQLYISFTQYAADNAMYAPALGDVYTQDHEIGILDWYENYSSFKGRTRQDWEKYADSICAGFPDEMHAGSEYYGTVGGNPGNQYGYWIRLPYYVFFGRNRPPRTGQTQTENWNRTWHGWATYSFEEARGDDIMPNVTPDMKVLGRSVAVTSTDGTTTKVIRAKSPTGAPAFGDFASYNGLFGYWGRPTPHSGLGCNVVFMDGHRTFTPAGAFQAAIRAKSFMGAAEATGAALGVKATYWIE